MVQRLLRFRNCTRPFRGSSGKANRDRGLMKCHRIFRSSSSRDTATRCSVLLIQKDFRPGNSCVCRPHVVGAKGVSKAVFISSVPPFLLKTPDNPKGVDGAISEGI